MSLPVRPDRPPDSPRSESEGRNTPGALDDRDGDVDDIESRAGLRAPPSRGVNSFTSFFFVTLMLFMLTNNSGEDIVARKQYRDSLTSLKYQQGNFSAWINGSETNFTMREKDPAEERLLDSMMSIGIPPNPTVSSYYNNMTGYFRSSTSFYNLTSYLDESNPSRKFPSQVTLSNASETYIPWAHFAADLLVGFNYTDAQERIGTWNWSACDQMSWSVFEKERTKDEILEVVESMNNTDFLDDVTLLHGNVDLTDSNTDEELRLEVAGVHFHKNGSIYGFAAPAGRLVEIRHIPSLVPPDWENESAQVVNIELLFLMDRLAKLIDAGNVEVDLPADEKPKTTCPFTFHAQLVPTDISAVAMNLLEEELDTPTGVPIPERPRLEMNAVFVSKECGIAYQVNQAKGLKSQCFWRKVTTYAGVSTIVHVVLLVLLLRQMAVSQTPAGISRVSRWTILLQAAVDAISFVGHICFSIIVAGKSSISLIAPAFISFCLITSEASFSFLIQQIQAPEETPVPPIPPPAPVQPTISNQEGTERDSTPSPEPPSSTPRPAPTPAPAPAPANDDSFWLRVWHHFRQSTFMRFWFMFLGAMTVFVHIIMSPSSALAIVGLTYSLFWLPQLIRSVRRGTSGGLTKEYLIGTTTCRSILALYFFACPENVLNTKISNSIYTFVYIAYFQVFVLILQEYFGPGFFLPKGYGTIERYDYHPPMPLPDAEAPEQSLGDCVICLDAIIVQPSHRRKSMSDRSRYSEKEKGKEGSSASHLLEAVQSGFEAAGRSTAGPRKPWALAPCHHLFHTTCLEKWLAIKNICPQCRRPLPPL